MRTLSPFHPRVHSCIHILDHLRVRLHAYIPLLLPTTSALFKHHRDPWERRCMQDSSHCNARLHVDAESHFPWKRGCIHNSPLLSPPSSITNESAVVYRAPNYCSHVGTLWWLPSTTWLHFYWPLFLQISSVLTTSQTINNRPTFLVR